MWVVQKRPMGGGVGNPLWHRELQEAVPSLVTKELRSLRDSALWREDLWYSPSPCESQSWKLPG